MFFQCFRGFFACQAEKISFFSLKVLSNRILFSFFPEISSISHDIDRSVLDLSKQDRDILTDDPDDHKQHGKHERDQDNDRRITVRRPVQFPGIDRIDHHDQAEKRRDHTGIDPEF